MPRFGVVTALAVVLALNACSDSPSPSAPSDPTVGDALTLQLDESVGPGAAADEATTETTGAQLGTGGKGKQEGVTAQVVSCVHNSLHQLCTDIRSGRLRAADGDAVANKNRNSTRGQLRINGVLVAFTNRFGPIFIGDRIFSRYRGLNIRVFRGDRICSQFPGATPQVCGVVR